MRTAARRRLIAGWPIGFRGIPPSKDLMLNLDQSCLRRPWGLRRRRVWSSNNKNNNKNTNHENEKNNTIGPDSRNNQQGVEAQGYEREACSDP
jgi:hypothetical protein